MSKQIDIRDILKDEIRKEIIGPREEEETFVNGNHPKARYLSGVLYPIQTPEDDIIDAITAADPSEEDELDDKVSLSVGKKPSSMGMICRIPLEQKTVLVTISYARYLESTDNQDNHNESNVKEKSINKKQENTKLEEAKKDKSFPDWKRIPKNPESFLIDLTNTKGKKELESNVFFRYFVYTNKKEKFQTLNVFVTNQAKVQGSDFIIDSLCVFQPTIRLTAPDSSKIFQNISRLTERMINEQTPSDRKPLFRFRNIKHFAQGRNCAVKWNLEEREENTDWVETTFIPYYYAPEIKPRDPSDELKKSLNMKELSKITNYSKYKIILEPLIQGYKAWIAELEKREKEWEKDTSEKILEKNFINSEANIPKDIILECKDALERIKEGIEIISTEPLVGESFRFANEVMYHNISHSDWAKKNKEKISKGQQIKEDGPAITFTAEWKLFQLAFLLLTIESITNLNSRNRKTTDLLWFPTGGGKTEAYYGVIAFTLAYRRIRGYSKKDEVSNSLEEELDRYGISVIMRYTYRLLTLQQFQRAITLFCACEYVRMSNPENIKKFGSIPFLVGLWVGRDTTPNSFSKAKERIKQRRENQNSKFDTSDPIQLLNCPWCGRELNAFNYEFEYEYDNPETLKPKRIRIRCNKKCFFGKPGNSERVLPVVFVDEDVRNLCPSLLISTVDKFAQITWNWRYATFFGNVSQYCQEHGYRPGNIPSSNTNDRCSHPTPKKFTNGNLEKIKVVSVNRKLTPPELIIQDELHLISGPLGTLTGIYETAVDILCTSESGIRPKIIASTATTKKSNKQIKDLFNSCETKIFPPQGFEFGDSYFAKILKINDEHPGKLHVGVCSTSMSGVNVDSRITACILRKIRHIRENKEKFHFDGKELKFTDDDIDPYFTLVSYYNTIKDLGGAMRKYEDTVPDYTGVIIETTENRFDKLNIAEKKPIKTIRKKELTGRVNATDIPDILQNIETKLPNEKTLDALLCTNMLSVGVDVDRLGVMEINGQPKSTSEYIQAAGRIGRKFPGIVITNYTYIRPRDLSYFENFIQFHSTYHKSVEPGTVTPFSSRARDRGLSGIFIALCRLNSNILSDEPDQFDSSNPKIYEIVEKIKKQILARVSDVDEKELEETEKDLKNIEKKWNAARMHYKEWTSENNPKLKYRRNPYTNKTESNEFYLLNSSRNSFDERTFVVPESLREAESEISVYYKTISREKSYG